MIDDSYDFRTEYFEKLREYYLEEYRSGIIEDLKKYIKPKN